MARIVRSVEIHRRDAAAAANQPAACFQPPLTFRQPLCDNQQFNVALKFDYENDNGCDSKKFHTWTWRNVDVDLVGHCFKIAAQQKKGEETNAMRWRQ